MFKLATAGSKEARKQESLQKFQKEITDHLLLTIKTIVLRKTDLPIERHILRIITVNIIELPFQSVTTEM